MKGRDWVQNCANRLQIMWSKSEKASWRRWIWSCDLKLDYQEVPPPCCSKWSKCVPLPWFKKKAKLNMFFLSQQLSSNHHIKSYFIGHRQCWVSTQFILQLQSYAKHIERVDWWVSNLRFWMEKLFMRPHRQTIIINYLWQLGYEKPDWSAINPLWQRQQEKK